MARPTAAQKWAPILEQFSASQQSAKKWCEQNNVSYQSLIKWKNKLKSKEEKFIELKPQEPIRLLWRGIEISFESLKDLKELKYLLEALC